MRDGLYKRGQVWWIRTDPVTGKRLSTHCKDRKAAQLRLAERERIAADPRYAAANQATVGDWVKRTLETKTVTRSAGTLHMYRVKLGHIVRLFGANTKMADVTPATVDEYVATRREEGAANNTIQRELTCLLQLCKLARRAGEFTGDVSALRPVGFSAGYVPRKRALTWPELHKLLPLLTNSQVAWVLFALGTGARLSEVHAFRREDYDPVRRLVRLRGTKTESSARTVPVLLQFRGDLEAAIEHAPFCWPRVSKDLPEACKRAGIEPVTPNDLRRTHATWLLEAGAEHSLVARMLGHKDSRLVERVYGRLSPERLGELLTEQTGTSTSQSHDEKGKNLAEAPWRNGRRRGFKRRSRLRCAGAGAGNSELARSSGANRTLTDVGPGTRTSHSPSVWALAYAAHSVGALL